MAKLFLHIGDHKTGTSAIQRALAAGPLQSGWLYPKAGRAVGAGHHNLPWEIAGDKRFRPAKGGWDDVACEIKAAAPGNIILSSEGFEFRQPERTAKRVEAALCDLIDDVEAVLYLRPHASRLISSFAERMRAGTGPFSRAGYLDEVLRRYALYAPRLAAWKAAFERRGWTLTVRVYGREHMLSGDAVSDFAAHVGLRALRPADAGLRNASPSAAALRMIQIFAEAAERKAGASAASRAARAIAPVAMRSYGPHCPPPNWRKREAERIRDALRADAMEVDDYLAREHGIVADFTVALDLAVAAADDDAAQHLSPDAEIAAMTAAEAAATSMEPGEPALPTDRGERDANAPRDPLKTAA